MLTPGDRIGDWVVDAALGEGGMGAVYRAHNALVPDIVAAVKILKPHALEESRERFFREVQAVHRLHHPNIVRVTGFGEDAERGLLWMAMDLVEGGELGDRIHAGPTPPALALQLFAGLVDALAHAHGLGVFHRDLKPANVLMDKEGRAKLVDFGIAVQKGMSRLTSTGLVVGTPAYMPPEVFDAEQVDPARADVYAIGQMLHEVLTGHAAFPEDPTLSEGQRMGRLLAAKIKTEALDPGEAFSPAIRALVREATAPEPADRIPTAAALRERIRRMAPETQWIAVNPAASVSAPTFEPDDRPVVAGTTIEIPADLPDEAAAKRGRRGGALRWVAVVLVVLLLGGAALVAAGGIAGAGAWYYFGFGDAPIPPPPLAVDTDVADTDVADIDLADTDLADTDLADTDLADTDLADTDEAPPPLVDPPPPPPPSTSTDISRSAAFERAWADAEQRLRRCEMAHQKLGGRQLRIDVTLVLQAGRVQAVRTNPASLSDELDSCIERMLRVSTYDASLTGTAVRTLMWKGPEIGTPPPVPPPDEPTAILDQPTVDRLIKGNSVVRRCMSVMRKELQTVPETVALAVGIGPDGAVRSVVVQTAEAQSTRAGKCLEVAVQRTAFPASPEGGDFTVTLTP